MAFPNTKDPRNALASWNGYGFQGQIALIVVLEMIIEHRVPIETCELILEDLEDFSICVEGERISTHQVKATRDKNLKTYRNALYQMVLGPQKKNKSACAIAYFHMSNALGYGIELHYVKKNKEC